MRRQTGTRTWQTEADRDRDRDRDRDSARTVVAALSAAAKDQVSLDVGPAAEAVVLIMRAWQYNRCVLSYN